jgi:hypothetical protein
MAGNSAENWVAGMVWWRVELMGVPTAALLVAHWADLMVLLKAATKAE